MKGRHRDIEPRQQQAEQQGGIAQHAQERRRDAILRRGHQNSKVDRREIAQRQAVDEQAGAPLEQGLCEAVRPLRVLQQRKGRRP